VNVGVTDQYRQVGNEVEIDHTILDLERDRMSVVRGSRWIVSKSLVCNKAIGPARFIMMQ
jgi:hypothetical protein